MIDEPKVRERLIRLEKLVENILKSIVLPEIHDLSYSDLVYEYRSEKAELFLELIEPTHLPRINDPELRKDLRRFFKKGSELIQKLKNADNEDIKEIGVSIEKELIPEFDSKREDEVEWDLLYEWFNPSSFVYSQFEMLPVIMKYLELPKELESLIYELRQCVAFQNYLAAGIMLRTIADIAVKDIVQRNYEQEHSQLETLGERLSFLSKKSSFSIPASALNTYRKDLNQYVHGKKLIDRRYILQYIEIVLSQIEEMYERSK
jgi:hypothetical protein